MLRLAAFWHTNGNGKMVECYKAGNDNETKINAGKGEGDILK